MNTLKKILLCVLMFTLLACVTLSFASCDLSALTGGTTEEGEENNNQGGNGETTHCPDDCECRADDKPAAPEHCPDDCECRAEAPVDTTPASITYMVVIRDDQGNIVPNVKVRVTDGTVTLTKTTDAAGFLTFPLVQGTWVAQIESAPLGYEFNSSEKYEFNADGVCAIELEKPVGYTFIAKSAYNDTVYADVIVELYAWDEDTDWYADEAIATGITDEEGKVTLEAVAGKYMVTFVIDGQKYIDSIEIDVPSDIYEVAVNDYEGSSIDAPCMVEYNEFEVWDVANGSVVWYSVRMANDKKIVINDADAFVIYNDDYYYPDEDGLIEVALVEDYSGNICFAIGYASEADDAEECKTIAVSLVAPVGSYENPIVLNDIRELDALTLEANAEGNTVYYKWEPTYSGKFYLLCDNANNYVAINNGSVYNEAVEGAAVIPFAFNAYDQVVIAVSATLTTEVDDGTGYFYDEVAFVAAELDFDAVVYAYYTATIFDLDSEYAVNAPVTFTDADGNVVATAYTDMDGMVKVLLPLGTYTVSTPAPAGYNAEDYEFSEYDLNAYITYAPYAFFNLPTVRGNYAIELEAGETKYFMFNVREDMKLTIGNADTATAAFGVRTFMADRGGNIIIEFTADPDPMNFMGALAVFSVTNTGTETATYYAKVESLIPGITFDDPIVIEALDTPVAATVVVGGMGASFLTFTATEAGTIVATADDANVSFTINNMTTYAYGEMGVNTITVAAGDVIMIEAGYTQMLMENVTFNVTISYQAAE